MTTLNEAPFQLQQWIKELDGQIGYLNEQRDALVVALELVGGEPDKGLADVVPAPARLDMATERRRAADRDRKARARAGVKQPPGSPGTSKYDYAEVARVANAAAQAGVSLGRAVSQKYSVTGAMSSWLIKEARKRGHDIPVRKSPAPAAPKLTVVEPPPRHPSSRGFTPDDTLHLLGG